MKNNEIKDIEFFEKQLSKDLGVYKEFQNSENNDRYFSNLHYKSMSKMENESSKTIFSISPAISYAMLFIISFTISFQFIDFSDEVSLSDKSYFFSETSLWIEEEDYLTNVLEEDINLDYESFISSELNYSSNTNLNDELNQLSDSELNELYENLKSKKIL